VYFKLFLKDNNFLLNTAILLSLYQFESHRKTYPLDMHYNLILKIHIISYYKYHQYKELELLILEDNNYVLVKDFL